ncbi:cyclic pyranopterin monophosphate synthase MoaC [Deltaproteobacteria bacterium OttesenSCG-928-M10]|nr:cyclic pyranopterin monophosphate synthase MoaC [Deltaproteobacteria bacterium OttesenSCG-928-M10]
MSERLTHLDETGAANMVDVGDKPDTVRLAVASSSIQMKEETLAAIIGGAVKKGDVLAAARLAGIMAAKRTAELIPLCHPLMLSKVAVDLTPLPGRGRIDIRATAKTAGPTGVEMEALTAASVAALTIYDMAKALDRGMVISDIKLLKKDGGRSGLYERPEE